MDAVGDKGAGQLGQWITRFAAIQTDMENLLLWRHIFNGVKELVANNPKIQRPSYFYRFLRDIYRDAAVMAIRRHSAEHHNPQEASFRWLLYDIRRCPELLTRARHVALYREVGWQDDSVANEEFDSFAAPGALCLEKQHVQPDIDAFLAATGGIERYATKLVAHLEVREPERILAVGDLDHAVDVLERLTKKYRLLIHGAGGPVLPVLPYPWEAIFTEPWIPLERQK